MFDIVIRGGTIVDGTGAEPYSGDVDSLVRGNSPQQRSELQYNSSEATSTHFCKTLIYLRKRPCLVD